MRAVIGFLCILFGLAITAGGCWVGFLLGPPGKGLDTAVTGGLMAFFFFGMWLFFLGIGALEKAIKKGEDEE